MAYADGKLPGTYWDGAGYRFPDNPCAPQNTSAFPANLQEKEPEPDQEKRPVLSEFERSLKNLINKYSMENKSATPDFILAEYLNACLVAFEQATRARERWYGRRVF